MRLRIFLLFFFIIPLNIHSQSSTKEIIDSLNSINDHEKKAVLCSKIALKLQDSDWDRAIKYIELAETEAKKTEKSELTLAQVYITAAKMYSSKEVLDIALQYYLKAHDIYKNNDNPEETAKVENNLAIIYSQGKNKEKALQYFLKVYRYQKLKNDPVKLVKILNNLGTNYLSKNLDSSLYYYHKARAINQTINNDDLKIYVCTNLARTYALKRDNANAGYYFNKAFFLVKNTGNNLVKVFVYESFADYNLNEKKYDTAILNAKKGLELCRENEYSISGLNLNKILYQVYINKQDYKNAVFYFQKYNTINDSIHIEEKAINLEKIKLEQEYKVRSQIKSLIEQKKTFKYFIIGLILMLGTLVLIILLIKYRKTNIKNQLEKEKLRTKMKVLSQNLDAKNKVLIGKAMSEIHRTDSINEILSDLKKIKLKAVSKETQQAIDLVLKRLEKNLNTNSWQEFEISFEQVHKSFFYKLIVDYPSLTPKDRRLCALLYLDLTTKEISQITGQSFKSIENARTRLRKKFDLTNEKVNLSTYLNTL
ncbi:Tetratricopeptide repeat-containing protein [Flavobacterium sp. CF108]|uniref:tetratricopeptide repeat protein n=1 Tax=unclassified Flavobacterium TaxID=196869 RepID=UPI0008D21963|nr:MULTISPECIES: tetratricopeptide repeat protein [unclassified Flavobacterium]SEP24345.1 Bacterial regulatory proteins, luxR family [Flavobacterium sp. fv08]SHI01734.1 Tetratricopeptide repeat-containing protein [Flavobacterium sp. CF108]